MKINIKDLNINQNSWNCGMQTIAEAIIAEVYKVDRKSIPFVSADFNQLKFKGINPRNFDEYFEIDLKIVPKLRFISKKKEDLNGKEKMAADIGADRKM